MNRSHAHLASPTLDNGAPMTSTQTATSPATPLAVSLAFLALGCVDDGPSKGPPSVGADGGPRVAAGDAGAQGKRTPLAWDPAFEGKTYSTKLPIVWVEVQGSHLDIAAATKTKGRVKIIEAHDGTHMGLNTRPTTLDTPMGISVRGSSSTGFPQKSYTIEVQRADGTPDKAPMLDMPSGEDWALVTCWGDKGCMRNALGLWMARQFGYWSSRTRFVEVYLNGRYGGIYLLSEAIRSDRNKVDIAKPAPSPDEGDVTGGYIFRKEAGGKAGPTANPPRDWLSSYKPKEKSPATDQVPYPIVYTYHYPRHHAITSAQRDYLRDYMARFEEMMEGPDWRDPAKGYRKWIDVQSWLDYALQGEVSNDVDHYFKSVYWVKASDKDGGKLFQMPSWDFDRVFGNANYRAGNKKDNWVHRMNFVFGGECSAHLPTPVGCASCTFDLSCVPTADKKCNPCHEIPYVPFYWDRLWTDPAFQDDMKCRWQELRKTSYDTSKIEQRLRKWQAELSEAVIRHFQRWQAAALGRVVSEDFVSPAGAAGDIPKFFDDEVGNLLFKVKERIEWLDANLPGTCKK